MRSWMIMLSLGILVVSYVPELPSKIQFCAVLLSLLALIVSWRLYNGKVKSLAIFYPLAVSFLVGLVWAILYGYQLVGHQIPGQWEKKDLWVEGYVTGLAKSYQSTGFDGKSQTVTRFDFRLDKPACRESSSNQKHCFNNMNLLRLKWFDKDSIKPGQRWRLLVRLKKPSGLANPGGFDYQSWLITQGYSATGYVRDSSLSKEPANQQAIVDRMRWDAAQAIDKRTANLDNKGLIKALIVGDKRQVTPELWQLFARTGTSHLMVISGLHVGLLAAMGFVIGRYSTLLLNWRWPADSGGAICAIVTSGIYSAAAGFTLPTQRALTMVTIWMLALLMRRQISTTTSITAALCICLIIDPLAAASLSFWLSFGAVLFILFSVTGRKSDPVTHSLRQKVKVLWISQWVVFVGLLPLLAILLGSVSLISPIANLILVPLFSLLIVPITMIGAIALWLGLKSGLDGGELAQGLWTVADWLLGSGINYLYWLDRHLSSATVYLTAQPLPLTLLAMCGAAVLLMPKGMPLKTLGVLLLFPIFFHRPEPIAAGDVRLTVLDVGQGLSILVETQGHRLLYDTGASVGDKFSAVSSSVMPVLRHFGISSIDTVVLSHSDNDHAGGYRELSDKVSVTGVLYGEEIPGLPVMRAPCSYPGKWYWDGVLFEFIYPYNYLFKLDSKPAFYRANLKSNNRSCVLRITAGDTRFLLPGDIEKKIETLLIDRQLAKLPAEVLIAPHHGSSTSSSEAFIRAVKASHVVFSSGYKNQFRHPTEAVENRYQKSGAVLHNTADSGAIIFRMKNGQLQDVIRYKETKRRYWL